MRKRSYLTVRNVPEDLARALERERKRAGASLNQTVVSALRKGLGLGEARRSNGLGKLSGNWDRREFDSFERHVRDAAERIDEELWR
jgi:hypothetical protein